MQSSTGQDNLSTWRPHLFEFGDQRWFPRFLRDGGTAYLAVAYRFSPLPGSWAVLISNLLVPGEPAQILDLCSGSGGPMQFILKELEKRGYELQVTLSDLYPNPQASNHPNVSWLTEPVDVTRVSPNLTGLRTMFSAFHHFRPREARAILNDAFNKRRTICIFESGSRSLLAAGMMIGVPLAVLALMPFARPFRPAYLLFTYVIPLLPLIVLWDGMVSLLRTYSPAQLHEMTDDLKATDYTWQIGEIHLRGMPSGLPYLIGTPIRTPKSPNGPIP